MNGRSSGTPIAAPPVERSSPDPRPAPTIPSPSRTVRSQGLPLGPSPPSRSRIQLASNASCSWPDPPDCNQSLRFGLYHYTNPHIEGHNRTFTEKLRARHTFTTREAIDGECARFNAESGEFFRFKFVERLKAKGLHYREPKASVNLERLATTRGKRICFIRFVEMWKECNDEIGIVILERSIDLPAAYLNQYVFASLDLASAILHVFSEQEGHTTEIRRVRFPYDA